MVGMEDKAVIDDGGGTVDSEFSSCSGMDDFVRDNA